MEELCPYHRNQTEYDGTKQIRDFTSEQLLVRVRAYRMKEGVEAGKG